MKQDNTQIQVGSKVKLAVEMEEGENKLPMYVIELNGDRCRIVTDCGLPFNPQTVVLLKDLILA